MTSYAKAVLARRPGATLTGDEIEIVRADVPCPSEGELLVRVEYLSMDVAMRGWMLEGHSYVPNIPLGGVPRACGAGIVVESRHPDFRQGDAVLGQFGVQEMALVKPSGLVKVDTRKAPLERWAGNLGITTGFTGYLGLLTAGRPKAGETVLVTGASGAVGSVVGQVARLKGCRTVGVAGGEANCARVVEDYGFDACIDYKSGSFDEALRRDCPERADVYFDNASGSYLDSALAWMRTKGRVVLCGSMSERGAKKPRGIMNLRSALIDRLTVQGFVVFDQEDRYAEAARDLGDWYASGALIASRPEDLRDGGIAGFVDALNDLLAGRNAGKMILKIGAH